MRQYRKTLTLLQSMLDLMTSLRKVRENIPVKETVSTVFTQRRELVCIFLLSPVHPCQFAVWFSQVSCICVSLHACEHAFRARRPLPQYLPSSRHALKFLVSHIEDSINEVRARDSHALGLSLAYTLAEIEVLKNLVDCMESLLDVAKTLFGTAAWLTEAPTWKTMSEHDAQEVHTRGWYSTF